MDINITKLSDKEIAGICVKYNIIQSNELRNYTRENVIQEIQKWCHYKKESYRQRSNSSPNIMMNQQNQQNNKTIREATRSGGGLKRTHSAPLNIQKVNLKKMEVTAVIYMVMVHMEISLMLILINI